MSDAKPARRRRHDAELKRQVIAACAAPSASVAQVAMSYGLNANLVHKWRRLAADDGEIRNSPAFVPVSVVSEVTSGICVLRRAYDKMSFNSAAH